MSTNSNLQIAKSDKNDEFYTLRSDIENELCHYDLSGLTIHCPCDNPIQSEFFKYLRDNFLKLGLKKLVATYYGSNTMYIYDGDLAEQFMQNDGDFAQTIPMIQSDIVITNPPFSLFRKFISLLVEHQKRFLCIGALNGVKYKDIFPLIKSDDINSFMNTIDRTTHFKWGKVVYSQADVWIFYTKNPDGSYYHLAGYDMKKLRQETNLSQLLQSNCRFARNSKRKPDVSQDIFQSAVFFCPPELLKQYEIRRNY